MLLMIGKYFVTCCLSAIISLVLAENLPDVFNQMDVDLNLLINKVEDIEKRVEILISLSKQTLINELEPVMQEGWSKIAKDKEVLKKNSMTVPNTKSTEDAIINWPQNKASELVTKIRDLTTEQKENMDEKIKYFSSIFSTQKIEHEKCKEEKDCVDQVIAKMTEAMEDLKKTLEKFDEYDVNVEKIVQQTLETNKSELKRQLDELQKLIIIEPATNLDKLLKEGMRRLNRDVDLLTERLDVVVKLPSDVIVNSSSAYLLNTLHQYKAFLERKNYTSLSDNESKNKEVLKCVKGMNIITDLIESDNSDLKRQTSKLVRDFIRSTEDDKDEIVNIKNRLKQYESDFKMPLDAQEILDEIMVLEMLLEGLSNEFKKHDRYATSVEEFDRNRAKIVDNVLDAPKNFFLRASKCLAQLNGGAVFSNSFYLFLIFIVSFYNNIVLYIYI